MSRLTRFFSTTIWEMESEAYAGIRRHGVRLLQIMTVVIRDFRDDQCLLRASALTFTTILSLVPFLALTFAVLKGFNVHNKVEPLILNRVAAGSQETVDRIITYIDKTNMTSLGAIGLVTLIMTVLSVLGNIEEAFNVIWGVKETRSFYRKFSDYMSVVITGPLLLFAGVSITSSLQSQAFIRWLVEKSYLGDFLLFLFKLAPYVTIWLALVFLYIFIPNTRVRFRSALIGGVIAGTIWQLAQWGYIHFQVGVAKYNAIYGTLAALPVFMVWIYASWLIVLFGVEVVCAHQNIRNLLAEARNTSFSHNRKELLSLAILEKIGAAFHSGSKPWTALHLAEELDIPVRVIRELLAFLMESDYILANAGENLTYTPARELDQIAVKDVILSLRNYGQELGFAARNDSLIRMEKIMRRLDDGMENALEGLTLKGLVTALPANSHPTGTDIDKKN
ncbi:MAG TPA: YhjD/YihY/BrkB family envelope integrity protein [Geobacteraceae bacterium]|nr:YhjD/YihY/BrkB family envelope integrity protein [Geobacteraceae bacterium]